MMIALCTIAFAASAEKRVSGTVLYAGDNSPLIGATIQPVGGGNGTATDMDGKFSLSVPDNVKYINVSYVGLATKQVEAGAGLTILLDDGGSTLDEVVVTAMGVKREKKALGYNTQNLTADQLNKAGTTSLASSIQGKLAGVQVRQASGAPGSSAQIVIRGARSFDGNNTPLYVVDGMPIASTSDYSTGQSVTGADYPNRSIDLNPEDIESINVLKGQAASALYGMRASNGVIVITTKRGRLNSEKPVITINTNLAADRVSRKFHRQEVYAQGSGNGFNPTSSMSWGPKIVDLPKDPKYGFGGSAAPAGGSEGQYYNPKYEIGGLGGWQTPAIYDNARVSPRTPA